MATKYTSNKLSLFLAEQFNESFYEPEPTSVGYVFIGNHIAYENSDTLVPEISDNWDNEKTVWDNMIAARRITGSDINIVLPVVEWQSNIVYDQYDDTQDLSTKNYYVVDKATRRVWKCLFNNNRAVSTTLPTVNPTSVNKGVIRTAGDRYLWKYMFTYPLDSKFESLNYVPVPLSSNTSGYGTSYSYLDQGAIYNLVVVNGGTGHARVTKASIDFGADKKIIALQNLTGVAVGMYVSGTNVVTTPATTVESILTGTNQVVLSQNTATVGDGTYAAVTNNLTFTPRVVIEGNGTGAVPGSSTLQLTFSGTSIAKVEMASFGTGYTEANVVVYSAGSGAVIRPIISPKYGHGYNPAKELGASSVMISTKIGEGDSTQGGIISDTIKFRQYGFLRDPHKYGNTVPLNGTTANNTISQLYDITLTTGDPYQINEYVYQGTLANPTFSGFVNSQTTTNIRLTRVRGTFTLGGIITGQGSTVRRNAIKIAYPEFEPYAGDILYTENVVPVERKPGQAELLRFVLTF